MFPLWKSSLARLSHAISWLLLAIATLIVLNIVARYTWSRFTIATYELVLYLHIWVIFISISYAMHKKAHIGINIVSERLKATTRRWLDISMTALLTLPTAAVILWLGSEYALASWRILEKSQETGGLDFIYLAKTAIPAGFALVLIQATLHIIERCLVDEPAKGAA